MTREERAEVVLHRFEMIEDTLQLGTRAFDLAADRLELVVEVEARALLDELDLFVRRRFEFIGRSLREDERVLQALLHRAEMRDALLEVGDLRLERGAGFDVFFHRRDDLVEKLVDVLACVTLESFLELPMLDVERGDLHGRRFASRPRTPRSR